ncbi:unnamed protein product, partial [Polarella glacialis]
SSDTPSTPPSMQGLSSTQGGWSLPTQSSSSSSSVPRHNTAEGLGLTEAAGDAGDVLNTSASLQMEEPCGLTPASLKHVRRQREALAEDKKRLEAELALLRSQMKEHVERVANIQVQLKESEERESDLRKEVGVIMEKEEAERNRADKLELLNVKLEETLALREAEIARLRKALEDQRALTQEVCEEDKGYEEVQGL